MPRRERRTGLRRDGGASSVEYGAILILVAALAAVFTVVALPERVKTNTAAAICQLFSGTGPRDCPEGQPPAPVPDGPPGANGPPAGDDPPDGPALPDPAPRGEPPAADPNLPPALDPDDPDVRNYNDAKNEADAANQALNDLNGLSEQAKQEIIDFLKDLVGITDIEDCLTKGDIIACISALAGLVPWGKVLKVLKKIPGAIKLAKKLKNLWDKLADARARKKKADDALEDAKKKLDGKACPVKKPPSSFLPGTRVLLADGTSQPIERIRVGDLVRSTDPVRGVTASLPVTHLIDSRGPKRLVTLSLSPLGRFGPTVTATANHPFWNPAARVWQPADRLAPGTPLNGRHVLASARPRTATARVHNLTIAGFHTYYVLIGGVPVLVHNENPVPQPGCGPLEGEEEYDVYDPVTKNRITDIDKIENGVLWELKSVLYGDEQWLDKQVTKKLDKYLKAREHIEGYENAPIGFRFTSDRMDPRFRTALENHFDRLRRENPGLDLRLEFVG
ncbi:Hint domain-containing protein [Actinocorallia libanotica]|uniref:Pretoxin HINT domain-containing protein n=1 Tax=Actinocorallia libanotica TaxID=46162 RepID=A0ABP4CBU7_9ACTN